MLLAKKIAKKMLNFMGIKKINQTPYPNPDFNPSKHAERVKKWQENDSDIKYRTIYPELNENSILLDLGGFHGEFAIHLHSKYGCECHIFEVIPELCEKIQNAIINYPKIHLHRFGLAGKNIKETLYLANEGSSVFQHRGPQETKINIELKNISEWMQTTIPGKNVDLIKINIEGGEYELLESIIKSGLVRRFKNIQVQFHEDVIPNAFNRMTNIHREFSKTHQTTFQELFIWENWKLKE